MSTKVVVTISSVTLSFLKWDKFEVTQNLNKTQAAHFFWQLDAITRECNIRNQHWGLF